MTYQEIKALLKLMASVAREEWCSIKVWEPRGRDGLVIDLFYRTASGRKKRFGYTLFVEPDMSFSEVAERLYKGVSDIKEKAEVR